MRKRVIEGRYKAADISVYLKQDYLILASAIETYLVDIIQAGDYPNLTYQKDDLDAGFQFKLHLWGLPALRFGNLGNILVRKIDDKITLFTVIPSPFPREEIYVYEILKQNNPLLDIEFLVDVGELAPNKKVKTIPLAPRSETGQSVDWWLDSFHWSREKYQREMIDEILNRLIQDNLFSVLRDPEYYFHSYYTSTNEHVLNAIDAGDARLVKGRKRGMSARREERALLFKGIKDRNLSLSYRAVASQATDELIDRYMEKHRSETSVSKYKELNELAVETFKQKWKKEYFEYEDVRNDYRDKNWTWKKGERPN